MSAHHLIVLVFLGFTAVVLSVLARDLTGGDLGELLAPTCRLTALGVVAVATLIGGALGDAYDGLTAGAFLAAALLTWCATRPRPVTGHPRAGHHL